MQFHQVLVPQGAGQVHLDGLAAAVDEAQFQLVDAGRPIQDLVDKAHLFAGGKSPHPAGGKIRQDRRFHRADGDDHLLGEQDAQRDGGIDALPRAFFLAGDVHQNQGVAVLQRDTGRFFGVEGGLQVGGLNVQGTRHLADLVLGGGGHTDPAAFLKMLLTGELLVLGSIDLQHNRIHRHSAAFAAAVWVGHAHPYQYTGCGPFAQGASLCRGRSLLPRP